MKQNLPDLITDESIILSDGRQKLKIPIRSLDEYRFRYNYNKSRHVGQGDGESRVGDVLGTDTTPTAGSGQGQGAGDQPSEDYFEAEVSLEELQAMLFEEMELPHLEEKGKRQMQASDIVFQDVCKKGIQSNLDKKRTILENLRRNANTGHPDFHGISPEDLRYKTWDVVQKPHSNAVILAMMDTSGSMGLAEVTKRNARSNRERAFFKILFKQ